MLSFFERLVAFRYLRARRTEGMISVIAGFSLMGIALGVATLIVVLAVMRGVRTEMINSIVGLEGHVTVAPISRGIEGYSKLTERLSQVEGVSHALPIVQGQVMLSHKGQAVGAMATGVRPQDLKYKPLVMERLVAGTKEEIEQGKGLVIGQRLAERLGIELGDQLTLISPEGRSTPMGTVPRVKAYPVAGIFNIGMFAYDNGLVLMPFEDAQVYFRQKQGDFDAASAIEVMAIDANTSTELMREIVKIMSPDFHIYDWQATNGHIFRAVMVQRNVFFMILALIILVASFNIVSSLIMLVREKGQDIAILRTMGATRASIMRIFILCGASVGVMGTALGVGLGLLIALNTEAIQGWMERMTGEPLFADELYFLSSLPAEVDPFEVLVIVAMSLTLSLLATLYPARKAAAMDPAEALRYE